MKKAKEDALMTREDILDAAFECFFENGFKTTSLEMIAKQASVTRGAVYWHFKDKKELYKEVVYKTLTEADVVSFAYSISPELSYAERLYEIFWFAQSENPKVDFTYKILDFVSQDSEFSDLKEAIQLEKIKLFRYFVEETRMHIQNNKISDTMKPEFYASDLFILFEGLFLTKNMSVGVARDRNHIEQYINLIIKDLI